MRKFAVALLLTVFCISLSIILYVGAFASIQPQSNTTITFEKTTFVSATGESIEAEKGWLIVPESHLKPDGNRIKLPVLRFKSTAEKPGSPIIYLAGGPGASGLVSARGNIFPVILALRDRADIIVFDQRGTGNAEPSLVVPGKFDLPLDTALDSNASRRQLLAKAREVAAEIRRRGIDLAAYNTNENADDVNDLRVALGAQKIILWGHSYGSHLGLAVLRRHGKFIDRAILSGVNGPDQRWRLPNDLQSLVQRVDVYLKSTPKLRRQMSSLEETVSRVLRKLDEKPVSATVQSEVVVVGRKDVEVLTALQSGDIEFVKRLPLIFGNMDAGEFSFVAAMIRGMKQREVGTAMTFSMHIASGVSTARASEIAKQKPNSIFREAINFPYDDPEFIAAWQVGDLGNEYRATLQSEVPTLFLSGTLDGRTSVDDAKQVMRGFSNGQLVVIEGAGHDFYQLTPNVLDAMRGFLDGKRVPERITVPFDLRGPDERKLVLELRKVILEKGIDEGIKRLREMNAATSSAYVTSYVPGTLGIILTRDDKRLDAATAVFKIGVELFPDSEFLNERLAESYATQGQAALARQYYQICVRLNSLNRGAVLKLKELGGGGH